MGEILIVLYIKIFTICIYNAQVIIFWRSLLQGLLKEMEKSLIPLFHAKCHIKNNCIFIEIEKEHYISIAKYLKNQGFKRLLTVSAIDWIDEEKFEIYFIAHNPDKGLYAKVSTKIPRNNPIIPSLSLVWENSLMHERETWELFGVTFTGNDSLKPLFLEDWNGPPPFRKDFNWREYVKEKGELYD